MTLDLAADSISEEQTRQRAVLHATKKIGGKDAPVNYSFEERVFSSNDTPSDKALAKQEVLESLKSRILSSEKPGWNMPTSNYDNMQMAGKCYKRTNVNAGKSRQHVRLQLLLREIAGKYPTLKPKSNRFNMGILEVALEDEYIGETFGDERMAKVSELVLLTRHLRDSEPWNLSSELTPSTRKKHFVKTETERLANSSKWKQKVVTQPTYKTPEQLTRELNDKLRQEEENARAALHAANSHEMSSSSSYASHSAYAIK